MRAGALVEQNKPASYKQIMSKDQAAFLQNLMAAVVSDGTGAKLSNQSYEAFGKTGTAQVSDSTDQTNAWFVGYGKKDGYNDLAIAVVVEDWVPEAHMRCRWQKRYLINISMNRLVALFLEVGYT